MLCALHAAGNPIIIIRLLTRNIRIEQGSKEKQNNPEQPQVEDKVFTDDELMSLIDPILKMDDISNDGYIDYPEFIRAQQKAAANPQQSHQ